MSKKFYYGKNFFDRQVFQKKEAQRFLSHSFQTEISIGKMPEILVSCTAMDKMWHYVNIAQQEVSWLGNVERQNNIFLIKNVFLLDQEVTDASTKITTEGLSQLASEIISHNENGIEIMNNLRFWGHSHVDMGVSPSTRDERQLKTFKESDYPWFIRGIFNKLGRIEFTIFLYDKGIKVNDVEWAVQYPVNDNLKKEIELEFSKKVREMEKTIFPPPWEFYLRGKNNGSFEYY